MDKTNLAFKSKEDANARLTGNTAPLTPAEVRDLLPWLGSLGGVEVLRLQAEMTIQQLRAIQEFDKSSRALTRILISLTIVIAALTVVLAFEPMRQIWRLAITGGT